MSQVGARISGPGIVTKPGIDIYSESQYGGEHHLGDTLFVGDRIFRWAQAGATALAPGKLCIAADPVANHQEVLLSAAVAAGGRILTPTMGATATTANQYKDGYLVINKATGFGSAYKIKSHPAADSSATCAITLYDDLEEAVDTTTEVSLCKNKYDDIIVLPTGAITNVAVGVPLLDVTATYYFWLQVGGPAPILVDTGETLVIGDYCGPQATVEVAGAVGAIDAQTDVVVGRVMYVATAAEYAMVDLTLL